MASERFPCGNHSRGSLPGRWPPTSALPAFGCFAGPSLLGKPDSVVGAVFQFRRPLSCPTTGGNIRALWRNAKQKPKVAFRLSTVARKHLTRHVLLGA